jgi:hypothetical protein
MSAVDVYTFARVNARQVSWPFLFVHWRERNNANQKLPFDILSLLDIKELFFRRDGSLFSLLLNIYRTRNNNNNIMISLYNRPL